MIDRYFPDPAVGYRLRAGPLGSHIEAYAGLLRDRCYAGGTAPSEQVTW